MKINIIYKSFMSISRTDFFSTISSTDLYFGLDGRP